MISASQIKTIAGRYGINPGIIERDYILSKILEGLSQEQNFQDNFLFKGGTALKKLFFTEWRFSEDLDFTLIEPMHPGAIKELFTVSAHRCQKDLGLKVNVSDPSWPADGNSEYPGYVGLKLSYTGPLAKASGVKNIIKIDLTQDEHVISKSEIRQLISVYPDDSGVELRSYSLVEIMAEKLRSIIERGKSRDYYDVWQLLKNKELELSFTNIVQVFYEKCTHKQITYNVPESFLDVERVALARHFWQRGLAHQLKDLPDFDDVMNELQELILEAFAKANP